MSSSSESGASGMTVFWENVRTVIYALLLAMLIRFMIAQPYRIPSGSMQPTLEIGDYILVTKWSYGYGRYAFAPLEALAPPGRLFAQQPKRGDIIVFRPPPDPNTDFVKRLIGLPGDRIQMIDGALFINGVQVQRRSLGLQPFTQPDGETIEIPAWEETLPDGGPTYMTFDRNPRGDWDNTRVYVVPEGHYFFMGDDRDNSEDSRVQAAVGFVPFDNIIGPAQFVIASFDGSTSIFAPWTLVSGFRADRFLHPLH